MRDTVQEKSGSSGGAEGIAVAQAELRTLIHRLADEVASFRSRAIAAEARQRELEQLVRELEQAARSAAARVDAEMEGADPLALAARVTELELDNAGMRERLTEAAERTSRLLERTRFLRQQQAQGEEVG